MFGRRLKELRKNKKLTQQELGDILNLTGRVIGYYESDDRFPDRQTLNNIADFFNVSIDYLLGRTNVKNNNNSELNKEKDIEKVIDELLEQDGLMLCGEIADEEDLIALRNSLRLTIDILNKKNNKKRH